MSAMTCDWFAMLSLRRNTEAAQPAAEREWSEEMSLGELLFYALEEVPGKTA